MDCCMKSDDKSLEILVAQLSEEVSKLRQTTTAKLLIQDGKIAETCVYIKNNLSNYLTEMFASIKFSGELNDLITQAVFTELTLMLSYDVVSENNIDKTYVFDNVDVTYKRNEEKKISYIVTKIKNLKPFVNFTNGTNANPYEDHKNVLDYMRSANKPVAINAGLRGVTIKDGVSHIESNTDTNEGFYILCITPDGNLKALPRNYTATEIISLGYRDAINIWSPIIERGTLFDEKSIDETHEDYDYIFNQKHPRQVFGTLYDGSYIIITIDGRMIGEKGANFKDIKEIVVSEGCETAYNLDGGASTQLVVGTRLMNRKLSDTRTIGTVITFESEVSRNVKCIC